MLYLLSVVLMVSLSNEFESLELESLYSSCQRSSDCFSHEHCWHTGECVDVSTSPCTSIGDCQSGESCNLEESPHRCE